MEPEELLIFSVVAFPGNVLCVFLARDLNDALIAEGPA
jgi:hypothetical protein